ATEGVYVGGVGSPCGREAQRAAEEAAAAAAAAVSGAKASKEEEGGKGGGGTRLERWVDGVPPVVDVVDADGSGVPSPLYAGRHRQFKTVCSRALRADWFISLLETCQEEAGVAWTFRLLAAMLQSSEEFGSSFREADGFRAMAVCLPRYAASLPVLLPALALALGVPVAALPATAEGMDAISILSLLRRNAGTAHGPGRCAGGGMAPRGGGGDTEPRPFVRVCLARVILPCLRVNAALLRRAEAAGVVPTTAVAAEVSPSQVVGAPPSPSGEGAENTSPGVAVAAAAAAAAAAADVSDWRRAKRVNELMSAAMWEALMNDPSFRLTCRSPGIVAALVDVLGGTWDEPEQGLLGGNQGTTATGGAGQEGTEVGVGDGSGSGTTSGGSSSAEGFPPQASPHPPAELLRIVIADIIATGSAVVFRAVFRVFSSGAAVMGPMLKEPPPLAEDATVEAAPSSTRIPRDLSPLGREAGSASAGIFQRAILRHLETCSREAINLAAAAASAPAPPSSSRRNRAGKSPPNPRVVALNRAVGSVAAVSAAVAEAAAEGLLPGVETGHLAVGLVLSLLRQITAALGAVKGAASSGGVRGTALGACHVTTIVALRRAIQRESGREGWLGGRARGGGGGSAKAGQDLVESWSKGGGGATEGDDGDLLEESLLMIAHNFDALLGEERRSSTQGPGIAGTTAVGSPPFPPPTPISKSPVNPKPRSPLSSASTTPRGGPESGAGGSRRANVPSPLDLSGLDQEASADAPLTTAGVFADTPAPQKWSSRFDFPLDNTATGAATAAAVAVEEANRLAMTFSALELPSIGSSDRSTAGGGQGLRSLQLASGSLIGSPAGVGGGGGGGSPKASNSLWESAAKGAAGLVAAADRGSKGGSSGGGGSGGGSGGSGGSGGGGEAGDDGGAGVAESLVYRLRGAASDRAFVAGFVAELRALLLSDSESVRKLSTRLAGTLLARRRATVQELLGEELLSTGFSMLEPPPPPPLVDGGGAEGAGGGTVLYPAADEEAAAEGTRAQAFALWLTGGGQEVAMKEGFERATERSYTLVPHVSSAEGLTAALSRAELAANGGGYGVAGGSGSSALSRLGSGVGGALGALAAGPNRKTITVDRAIQRADMIARTYERVATSHGRWVWTGADDLAWASRRWRVQLSGFRGKVSLWEGGLFGRLMCSPEAIAALRPGADGWQDGVDGERYKLDMDEGPERARLHLRPNRDFYDTYEVMAPALPASSAAAPAAAGVAQEASASAAAAAAAAAADPQAAPPLSAAAATTDDDEPSAGMAAAAVVTSPIVPSIAAGAGSEVPPPAAGSAGAAAAAAAAAKSPDQPVPPPLPPRTIVPSASGGGKSVVRGGGQVADIAALVRSMSVSVGVGRKAGPKRKQQLTGVFDLDDTDCSALQELEELRLEDAPDGAEDESFRQPSDSTDADLRSPVDNAGKLSPSLGAEGTLQVPPTPASQSEGGSIAGGEEVGGGEIGAAARRAGAEHGGRDRSPGRGFSLGESDLMDGDTSEMSALDDDHTVHGSEISGLDAQDMHDAEEESGAGDDGSGDVCPHGSGTGRGRSPRRAAAEKEGGSAGEGGVGGACAAELKQGHVRDSMEPPGASDDGRGSAPEVPTSVGVGSSTTTTATSTTTPTAPAGPGTLARKEGWSDRELLLGLTKSEDSPVIAAHDVSRSVGGVVVKRGLLLVCRNAVYFVDGFGREPALPRPGAPPPTPTEAAAAAFAASLARRSKDPLHGAVEDDDILAIGRFGVQRFALDHIHAVYKRRYQLRDCGLEIFDVLGRSILVSFAARVQQEEVLTFLLARGLPVSIFAKGKHKLRLASGSSHAQARAAYKKFMQAERISWTKKWQSGRCTNFAYLMALNTLAGRSFNDLTQYPVFPWILCDYVSEELDLDNPRVYRDLSKPMGAIGETRARQFTERYEAVIEAAEETGQDPNPPPFHYGTHYSCAGYILHYLLRLEPFTKLALALQGGRFDKADRLFRDVRSSWESASRENLQVQATAVV
ncbi:unnamed protein product, partial [Ectocarpus fasciculatus]